MNTRPSRTKSLPRPTALPSSPAMKLFSPANMFVSLDARAYTREGGP